MVSKMTKTFFKYNRTTNLLRLSPHITILIKLLFSTQLRGAADGQFLLWFVEVEATNNRKHTLPEENYFKLIT